VEEAQIKTAKCDQLRTERLKLQEVTVLLSQLLIQMVAWRSGSVVGLDQQS